MIKIGRSVGVMSSWKSSIQVQIARSLYLHSGARVRGLKRLPEDALTNHTGQKWAASSDNLQYIQSFLNTKYAVPDELAIQVLTHKSFNNGIKPHNEKLAALGSKLLSLYFMKTALNSPTTNETTSINGKNLDSLGSKYSRTLCDRAPLALFAKEHKLSKIMFWTSYNPKLAMAQSGELKVSGQMMYALVGAVALAHGKPTAESFIEEKLVKVLPSLYTIAEQLVAHDGGESESI